MYTSWLTPTTFSPGTTPPTALGYHFTALPSPATRVALIGAHSASADRVRRHLYALYWDHGPLALTDLGNLRKRSTDFVIPLLRELHEAGIAPVLLGGVGQAVARAQYLAFGSLHRQIGLFSLDQHITLSAEVGPEAALLDAAVHRSDRPVYHLAHAGSQRQLIDPRLEQLFEQRHFEHYSLGEARAAPADLEPCIRDADIALIDVGAILHAEAPAQVGYHPSGFSLQEAGQFCYYAGNSDRLSSFGIYGWELDAAAPAAAQELTAAAYAQLVWYFLHGMSRRSGDFPASTTGMTEYIVDARLPQRMTFWRSPRSNRWWVQVPAEGQTGEERNRLVACSYEDYVQTSQEGKLPDRIVRAFSRY